MCMSVHVRSSSVPCRCVCVLFFCFGKACCCCACMQSMCGCVCERITASLICLWVVQTTIAKTKRRKNSMNNNNGNGNGKLNCCVSLCTRSLWQANSLFEAHFNISYRYTRQRQCYRVTVCSAVRVLYTYVYLYKRKPDKMDTLIFYYYTQQI